MNRLFPIALITLASSVLVACGGSSGSGAATVVNQDTSNEEPVEFVYTGPDPVSSDVQNFRVNVWDNLVSGERCGACHTNQEPAFLQTDDINAAYAVANEYVDLDIPSESRLVTKVAEDHNCWESVSSVCADIITGFIENWAAASGTVANTITFTPPTLRDVADSKNFPQEVTDFENTVYPLLETFCSDCHSEDAPTQQQPFLGSADALVSYEAAKSRIDLTTPANSRLVVRLLDDA
jgi:mono/diheme cytochrome c family protein